MPNDSVVVKLDFSNAFNCLRKSDMLKSIADRVPELLSYCHSAYANPSVLHYGHYTIMSLEGPQQGDPLGPLLFCNTIHALLESLGSVLRLGYMDDVTLGGSQGTVAKDRALSRRHRRKNFRLAAAAEKKIRLSRLGRIFFQGLAAEKSSASRKPYLLKQVYFDLEWI